LHFVENEALLHLTDEFLLDNAHEERVGVVNSVRIILVILTHALCKEVFTAVTSQS
jgi:hypothetical protein